MKAVDKSNARTILRELHKAGGCDATDEYSKGWDAAITEAIQIVSDITKVTIEEALEEPEPHKRNVVCKFHKDLNVHIEMTQDEIHSIATKGLPEWVWNIANDDDSEKPLEFDRLEYRDDD